MRVPFLNVFFRGLNKSINQSIKNKELHKKSSLFLSLLQTEHLHKLSSFLPKGNKCPHKSEALFLYVCVYVCVCECVCVCHDTISLSVCVCVRMRVWEGVHL